MNAVAQEVATSRTPIEQALVVTYKPVIVAIGDEQTSKVAAYIQNLVAHGENALQQAEAAVIEDEENFGLAGDLVKAITGKINDADARRKAVTKPMDDAKDAVMKLFKVGVDKLTAAKKLLGEKQTAWGRKERERKDALARAEQEAATQRALDLAAAQQSMGDNAGADQVLAEAAETIQDMGDTKVSARGMYGSTSGMRGRWVGSVESPRAFLLWMLLAPRSTIFLPSWISSRLGSTRAGQGIRRQGLQGRRPEDRICRVHGQPVSSRVGRRRPTWRRSFSWSGASRRGSTTFFWRC